MSAPASSPPQGPSVEDILAGLRSASEASQEAACRGVKALVSRTQNSRCAASKALRSGGAVQLLAPLLQACHGWPSFGTKRPYSSPRHAPETRSPPLASSQPPEKPRSLVAATALAALMNALPDIAPDVIEAAVPQLLVALLQRVDPASLSATERAVQSSGAATLSPSALALQAGSVWP